MKYGFRGLSENEVLDSRNQYGSNYIPPPPVETFWQKFKENFQNPLIQILLIALCIIFILAYFKYTDWFEGIGIAIAILIATLVSTYAEYKNETNFQKLQHEASNSVNTVFRNAVLTKVNTSDTVVGDYVLLQAGDKIPADGILVAGELGVNQLVLNGEADTVTKTATSTQQQQQQQQQQLPSDLSNDLAAPSKLFRGSVVDEGEGVLLVQEIGVNTVYGRLFNEINIADSSRESPLQVKLRDFADQISKIGYYGAALIAGSFLFKKIVIDNKFSPGNIAKYFSNWQTLLTDIITSLILGVIIIVVAVPEGLPMMIANVLSQNMNQLLEKNVLVRKLLGIETAGSMNILFLDKTGTITHGKFDPVLMCDGNINQYQRCTEIPPALQNILRFALHSSSNSQFDDKGEPIGGNASERALLSFLGNNNSVPTYPECKILSEQLFNSNRKYSATSVTVPHDLAGQFPESIMNSQNTSCSIYKGAPEIILTKTSYYIDSTGKERTINKDKINRKVRELAAQGLRLIAIAAAPVSNETTAKSITSIPDKLRLLGIIGIQDQIRPEAKEALGICRNAGIQVVMVTGDKKETAETIGRQVGFLDPTKGQQLLSITSDQLNSLSDDEVANILPNLAIVSRALPTDKSRLVRIAQKAGKVVGMTGDGVNDVAALTQADVGYAMGSGSEVAKEAADIVILDNNFMSITQSVLFGRTIFKSIRKFITYQSTVSLSAGLITFLGPFLGYTFPLTIIQLLWVNLVMDSFAAMSFAGEPPNPTTMNDPPIARDEPIVTSYMWSSIIANGLYTGLACVAFLVLPYIAGLYGGAGSWNPTILLTAFFALFIFFAVFNAFNVRTNSLNLFSDMAKNPKFIMIQGFIIVMQIILTIFGGSFLRTVPLSIGQWLLTLALAFTIIPFDLIRKMIVQK